MKKVLCVSMSDRICSRLGVKIAACFRGLFSADEGTGPEHRSAMQTMRSGLEWGWILCGWKFRRRKWSAGEREIKKHI